MQNRVRRSCERSAGKDLVAGALLAMCSLGSASAFLTGLRPPPRVHHPSSPAPSWHRLSSGVPSVRVQPCGSRMVATDLEDARDFADLDDISICCIPRPDLPGALGQSWRDEAADVSVELDFLGGDAAKALQPLLDLTAPGANRELVLEEFETLGTWFQGTMRCAAVSSRLEIMEAEKRGLRCPLYHTDKVSCRLSVSYCGPGTEFLLEKDLRRTSMLPWMRRGQSLEDINAAALGAKSTPQVCMANRVCNSMT